MKKQKERIDADFASPPENTDSNGGMGTETVSEVENDYAGCELFMEADSIDDEPAPEVRSSARRDGRTV